MNRRTFIRGSAGLAAGLGLAGCSLLGGTNAPPPRDAKVLEDVSLDGQTLEMTLESSVKVESRAETNQSDLGGGAVAASLLPVGVASAAKGGRGATGRGSGGFSGARKGRHGWAVWHGGDYEDDWREEHSDELQMYDANVKTLGIAYLGDDNEYEENPPGPADVNNWDETWDNPEEGQTVTAGLAAVSPLDSPREGWYRIGEELVSEDGEIDFGWQGHDLEVGREGNWAIDKAWHVRPRV